METARETISSKVQQIFKKHNINYRITESEITAESCPFCKGGEHGDRNTFGVSLDTGAFSCLRGSCGKRGGFRDLLDFFGENMIDNNISVAFEKRSKTYVRPDPSVLKPLTKEIIDYFNARHISQETLNDFNIASNEDGHIAFPFYRNKELIGLKFRKPIKRPTKEDGPKEWSSKQMEPILFGMDNCSFNSTLYITEGQIDAMSLYEAGIRNVVSVPMGCNNLEFVEICWEWLSKFNSICLFGDGDEPGMAMILTLSKRLGEERCLIPPAYPQAIFNGQDMNRLCKDANEILLCYGKEGLLEVAKSCEPVPVKGIINLADVRFTDPMNIPRVLTKIPKLDDAIGGMSEGTVNVFTGKRGEGKSTLNGQLLLNAVQQGYKVCAYSGELSQEKFLEWILLQACERRYVGVKQDPKSGKNYATVDYDIQSRIKKWIDGKFFLFDNNIDIDMTPQDAILKVFNVCAKRYGCKVFLVDNLMSALQGNDEEFKAQAKFMSSIKNFAVKYNAIVIVVAHPRKTKFGESITNDDVSGNSA